MRYRCAVHYAQKRAFLRMNERKRFSKNDNQDIYKGVINISAGVKQGIPTRQYVPF
jgi:hypothetical protein